MQNKGAIKVFTVFLALACLFQLVFTWKTNSVEEDARRFSLGDKEQEKHYLDSMQNVTVLNLVVAELTYAECKQRQIGLGLDLKGGVNVTLEISMFDYLKGLSSKKNDPVFNQILMKTRELQSETPGGFIDLFAQAAEQVAPDQQLITYFSSRENIDRMGDNPTDEQVLAFLADHAEQALQQSKKVLRKRVHQFGVAQPNIQTISGSGRILVELPGVHDLARIRKLLQGSANLEFWETYHFNEVANYVFQANNVVYEHNQYLESQKEGATAEENKPAETTSTDSDSAVASSDTTQIDSAAIAEEKADEKPIETIMSFMAMNVDQNTRQPNPGPVVGYARVKDTAKINKYLRMAKVQAVLPKDLKLLWSNEPDEKSNTVSLFCLKDTRSKLQGEIITRSRNDYDPTTSAPVVYLNFTQAGTHAWKLITTKAAKEQNRAVAIVLDNFVYSAPSVNEAITTGSCVISGVSEQEAKDLSNVLNAGRFPAPAKIVDEAVVGPTLGAESIRSSVLSFGIALVVVLIYMAFYYSKAGIVADIALVANMFFILGALASFHDISLTLPGVAGIVLTIGMSVDANVLIYERIREELKSGKGIKIAIQDGYKHAYTAILDANVTTLLTGLILWYFGSGPVEGFAKTLVIGIFTSLFSAIFITRLIFEGMLEKQKDIQFASPTASKWFQNTAIKFVPNRKKYYIFSLLVIALGIGSFVTRNFDLGVDFSGGRNYVVRFPQAVEEGDIKASLEKVLIDNGTVSHPEVKQFGASNQMSITTNFMVNSTADNVAETVDSKIYEGLKSYFPEGFTLKQFSEISEEKSFGLMTSRSVAATIADDIKFDAIQSIIISLLVIFAYVAIRFQRLQFGIGALLAIFHDVLVVLSLFSLLHGILPFSMEISQAFIAAILTVVGYSINDTVVVFDRIREFLARKNKQQMPDVVNSALNSTLGRTFNTSITIVVVLLAILIFGGESIKGFAFALLVGVIVGTYSSLCIASPVVLDLAKKKEEKN